MSKYFLTFFFEKFHIDLNTEKDAMISITIACMMSSGGNPAYGGTKRKGPDQTLLTLRSVAQHLIRALTSCHISASAENTFLAFCTI